MTTEPGMQPEETWESIVKLLAEVDTKVDELLSGKHDSSIQEDLSQLKEFSRVIKISLKELKQIAQGIPFEAHQLRLLLEMAETMEEKIRTREIPGQTLLFDYRQTKSDVSNFFESVNISVKLMHQVICGNR